MLAYADKRLTILNTHTHPTDQPIDHLRGQQPMTASEPPAKWGADSRGDDDVVCRVEEGRAAIIIMEVLSPLRGSCPLNNTALIK